MIKMLFVNGVDFAGVVVRRYKNSISNIGLLLVVNILASLFSFITTIQLANVLGRTGFGHISYGMAIGMYGAGFVLYGTDRTLVRDLVHAGGDAKLILRRNLLFRIFLFVVGVIVILVITVFAEMQLSDMMIALSVMIISLDLQALYDYKQKIKNHSLVYLIYRLSYSVIVWVSLLILRDRIGIGLVGCIALMTSFVYVFVQYIYFRDWLSVRYNKNDLYYLWKYAKSNISFGFASIIFLSFGSLNQIILKNYSGAAAVGEYSAAWQIVAVIGLIQTQMQRVGRISMARITVPGYPLKDAKRFVFKYMLVMTCVALIVGVPPFFMAEYLVKKLFVSEYAQSAQVMQILTIYMVVFSVGIVASQYIVARDKNNILLGSVAFGAVICIALAVKLVPNYGATGAAMAMLISYCVTALIYVVVVLRDLSVRV